MQSALASGRPKRSGYGSTILAILMSETLPRLTNAYGAANAALILSRIAHEIRVGRAPNIPRQ